MFMDEDLLAPAYAAELSMAWDSGMIGQRYERRISLHNMKYHDWFCVFCVFTDTEYDLRRFSNNSMNQQYKNHHHLAGWVE